MPVKPQLGVPAGCTREVATADGSVLLDIRQDLCVGLTPVGAKIWHLLEQVGSVDKIVEALTAEFPEVPRTQIYSDTVEFVADLRAKGILVDCNQNSRLERLPGLLLAVHKVGGRFAMSVRRPHLPFWESLAWLIGFDLFLGKDFTRIYTFVKDWKVGSRSVPHDTTQTVCRAINHACMCYPKRVLCLQRSLATTCLLRSYGIPAQMVVGAQKVPFKAHAWTEVAGRPVNERRDVQGVYLVWERF